MDQVEFQAAEVDSLLLGLDENSAKLLIATTVDTMSSVFKQQIEGIMDKFFDKLIAALPSGNDKPAGPGASHLATNPIEAEERPVVNVTLTTVKLVNEEEYSLIVPHGIEKMLLGLKTARSFIRELLLHLFHHDYSQLGNLFLSLNGNVTDRQPEAKLLPEGIQKAILAYLRETWLPKVKNDNLWNDTVEAVMKSKLGVVLRGFREVGDKAGLNKENTTPTRARANKRRRTTSSPESSPDPSNGHDVLVEANSANTTV